MKIEFNKKEVPQKELPKAGEIWKRKDISDSAYYLVVNSLDEKEIVLVLIETSDGIKVPKITNFNIYDFSCYNIFEKVSDGCTVEF